MRSLILRSSLVLAGAAGLALTAGAWLRAEPSAATPVAVAEIKDVMNYSNHKTHGLFGLLKAMLKTEPVVADWKIAAARAVGMAEAANTILPLPPPRNGDTDEGKAKWAQHCAAFRDAAKELAKQCKLKKYEEAKKAIEAIEARCEACHADHQPE